MSEPLLREMLKRALREGRHNPMCDRSRCVCWKADAKNLLASSPDTSVRADRVDTQGGPDLNFESVRGLGIVTEAWSPPSASESATRIAEIGKRREKVASPLFDIPHPQWEGASHRIDSAPSDWTVFGHIATVSTGDYAQFFVNAPEDIDFLLFEVTRLSEKNAVYKAADYEALHASEVEKQSACIRGLEAGADAMCSYCRSDWPLEFQPAANKWVHKESRASRVCAAGPIRALISESKG